ncbi:glycosyltransferase [Candidatus Omnitrophota bacterium]
MKIQKPTTHTFCTIVTYRYIPQFLVQQSYFKNTLKNNYTCWVLCIDYESYLFVRNLNEPNVKALYWHNIADQGLLRQHKKHEENIATFCWICKTYFLKYLICKEEVDKVVYLDSDMVCLDDQQELFDCHLEGYDICLTPHYFTPSLRQKGYHKKSGNFNAGFIAVNRNAIPFLNWWQKRCYHRCGRYTHLTPAQGGLDDQGYLDAIPKRFTRVKKLGKEYNVAPWNSGNISKRNGNYFVGKKKVKFYHFQQLIIDDWHILSIHSDPLYSTKTVQELYIKYQKVLDQYKKKHCVNGAQEKLTQFLREADILSLLKLVYNLSGKSSRRDTFSIEKALHGLYIIASEKKRQGKNKKAEQYFYFIAKSPYFIPDSIRGGAYFHLGEILLNESRNTKAQQFFNECLKRIPEHKKAQLLLSTIMQ